MRSALCLELRCAFSVQANGSGPVIASWTKVSQASQPRMAERQESISSPALVGFRGGGAVSRNQACDKGAEQGSPTPARVVYELEESKIERQLVLRDAPMRAEPGAQQRPEPFHGVDVHLAEAVPVLVAGILTPGMADRLVLIAPGGQASVDAILVGVDEGALSNGARDDRLDRPLLHVGQHVQDHWPTSLDQAEDRGLILLRRAPPRYAPQLASPPRAPLLATARVGPCGRPRRKPRRSPPRPPASPPGSGPPDRGAAVRSWPEHRTGSAPAPRRSAGSRGSAP